MFKKFIALFVLFAFVCSNAFAGYSGDGRKVVAAGGTAVALSATAQPFQEAFVCAATANTNDITVGSSTVVGAIATRRGVNVAKGTCITIRSGDLATVYIDAITNGDAATFYYYGQG